MEGYYYIRRSNGFTLPCDSAACHGQIFPLKADTPDRPERRGNCSYGDMRKTEANVGGNLPLTAVS